MSEKDYLWDIANATKMGEYITRKEREFIDSFLNDNNININTCLDVACGSGRLTIPISQHGINIVAADYDLVPLRKLKDKIKEGGSIMAVRGDMNNLPFKAYSFDCIICIQAVDYTNVKNLLKDYNKILRKDGFLLFTTANKRSYKRYIHSVLSSYRTFYRYSFEDIKLYLEKQGFEVKKSIGYNWIPFKRDSNSVLLGFFEFLENILRLSYFTRISPWVFFIAKKKGEWNEDAIHVFKTSQLESDL